MSLLGEVLDVLLCRFDIAKSGRPINWPRACPGDFRQRTVRFTEAGQEQAYLARKGNHILGVFR